MINSPYTTSCRVAIWFFCSVLLFSCSTSRRHDTPEVRYLPEVSVKPSNSPKSEYKAAQTKYFDLIKTHLDLKPVWEKQELIGRAVITLKPHWYPQSQLLLQARGFTIDRVELVKGRDLLPLNYHYQSDSLLIQLDRTYSRNDSLMVSVTYTAHPEKLEVKGGDAIHSDKGMFFINPLGLNTETPKQLWTQSETQAASAWYPTLDAPNQKMSQVLQVCYDSSMVSLSNGRLASSQVAANGNRCDTWIQDMPHAPYLACLVIGKFAVTKDHWRGKEVNYYTDPEYKDDAFAIFGETPAMLEFFSRLTGVDYPWDKYSQVIVHEFVSGAMENTTATVHGDFLQRDKRELLDRDYEEFISHELFHHWFGDLVTCESWSNAALNESFATYGEYLWNEYRHGRETADQIFINDLSRYLRESKEKQVDLIRYHYADQQAVFDSHSYEKGGRILHMLRYYLGDEAFFASITNYLQKNRFKTVEADDLRMAFEEVSGQDLHWFFNQWFFAKGHPVLDISYQRDHSGSLVGMVVKQLQDSTTSPIYKLPLLIDQYTSKGVVRKSIVVDQAIQSFPLDVQEPILAVNFDAEKMLLCEKIDHHSIAEWQYLQQHAPLYTDRWEALRALSDKTNTDSVRIASILTAIHDRHPQLRKVAIQRSTQLAFGRESEMLYTQLQLLAAGDSMPYVRTAAILALKEGFKGSPLIPLLRKLCNDSSIQVSENALFLLAEIDTAAAMEAALKLPDDPHHHRRNHCFFLYTKYGSESQADSVLAYYKDTKEKQAAATLSALRNYLLRLTNSQKIREGISAISDKVRSGTPVSLRSMYYSALKDLGDLYLKKDESEKGLGYDSVSIYAKARLQLLLTTESDADLRKTFTQN